MLKTAFIAALCALILCSIAQARPRAPVCVETGSILFPSCMGGDFLAGVRSIKVRMHRARPARRRYDVKIGQKAISVFRQRNNFNGLGLTSTDRRPHRYIRARLACARNVNLALAERGITGTGSALAHSFDHWGVRVPVPVVGAVAVTDRRGGGHVAIVSRVEGSRVFVFNPGRRGWTEREYTSRHARYRVAG